MSAIARWSYKNTATVRPFISINLMSGEAIYGTEYTIACGWIAEAKQERETGGQGGARGAEFISRHIVFTEDARPKELDMILLSGRTDWEEIRSATTWEMAAFNDTPDYRLVT